MQAARRSTPATPLTRPLIRSAVSGANRSRNIPEASGAKNTIPTSPATFNTGTLSSAPSGNAVKTATESGTVTTARSVVVNSKPNT